MNRALEASVDETLSHHLHEAYMEIFPAPGIVEKLAALKENDYVAVTCSPTKGVAETLALTAELIGRGYRVVPHIAARNVRDLGHLREIMSQLADLGIDSLFVPGGDRAQPIGEFPSALSLLQAIHEFDHKLAWIGVGAHPEGHPAVDNVTLRDELLRKQQFANYMVTQMCFDAEVLAAWLQDIRAAGISMPAWIGLPGAIERSRLLHTSMRIGVGDSLRFLRRNLRTASHMMRSAVYHPDELLRQIAPCAADPANAVVGYHLFCFNQVE
ncbi:MAG TPA: methylenetetrahydrofolate reductase, partial [Woeseiaceae bacterium]|nr:methylenetetrahydrofolate reductase [Woeseiaceae bacterium]